MGDSQDSAGVYPPAAATGMEVVLLGSGAADGWPNPFCECASCAAAARAGQVRSQSAALVDGRLMLDCGPEAPRAAVAAGRTLAGVRHILVTHSHPDHLGPAALLFRQWAQRREPLDVVGPRDVIAQCRPWVGPADPVRFIEVEAGDEILLTAVDEGASGAVEDAESLAGTEYLVRVLASNHRVWEDGDAVLYDVTSRDVPGSAVSGSAVTSSAVTSPQVSSSALGRRDNGPRRRARILWASDTGPLPERMMSAVAGARFDAVFLEESFGTWSDHGSRHLDLTTFPRAVAALRDNEAISGATQVVAVHLSHHNPAPDELALRLGRWGARIGEDGMTMRLPSGDARTSPDARPAGRALVLGGVRSGKSALAEELLADARAVTYLATGGSGRGDAEWSARVAAHKARRPATWRTVETTDVVECLRCATSPVLLDCLGTWLTARIDLHGAWDGGPIERVDDDISELVAAWRSCPQRIVAVSNEVGSGVVPASASGRLFRDMLGRLNAAVAAESESVTLVVAGIPMAIKGSLERA